MTTPKHPTTMIRVDARFAVLLKSRAVRLECSLPALTRKMARAVHKARRARIAKEGDK